jgi:isocitrate/isopropylmalate dehydrogenase
MSHTFLTEPSAPCNHDFQKRICVLPGDGVGREVMSAAIPVIAAHALPLLLDYGEIGWELWRTEGEPIPERTWKKIRNCDAVLLGATTTMPLREAELALRPDLQGRGLKLVSPIIQLRQKLNLFANIRPIRDILGSGRYNFTVIRENTEGLYAGLDFPRIPGALEPLLRAANGYGESWSFRDGADATVAMRLQTRTGLHRIFKYAFEYARLHGFNRVTLADKPNVLRYSGAFARQCLEEVASGYSGIESNIENVDAVALWMVRRPERFGVIVAENMFGDILSDLGAGIMGGLGLAPSANIGETAAYFEPVHGSAPRHVGRGSANPSAMFLTIAMMLRRLGFDDAGQKIETSVAEVARSEIRTPDLGGRSTTTDVASEIIARSVA